MSREMFQSAPAIAGGRCQSAGTSTTTTYKFQSAPAIAGGRCPAHPGRCSRPPPVSIRARHCWRAMPSWKWGGYRGHQFQSAPAIAGGRCAGHRANIVATAVSIRARHCWRAMPHGLGTETPIIKVSIRARHCWRAMRRRQVSAASRKYCFNPRPPLLAGDAPCGFVPFSLIRRFQSAPAIAGGRCQTMAVSHNQNHCFNPRPPLLAGDAAQGARGTRYINVSIRARHCWRAMRTNCQRRRGPS